MRLCADTWFLLELANESAHAVRILKDVEKGKHILFVPVLAVSEITNLLYQRGASLLADAMIANLVGMENISVVDINLDIAKEIAKIKHSFALSIADASMVATYKIANCDIFLAVDSDYKTAVKQNIVKIKPLTDV